MQHDLSVINLHRELDHLVESGSQLFISNWNGKHPFSKKYIGRYELSSDSLAEYSYIRANKELSTKIIKFHQQRDKYTYDEKEILASNGSTTIITAFFTWLVKNNIKELYYIPPVYFTFNFFANAFDIKLRPISKGQLFEPGITINLPDSKSILVLTDPIWYTGCSVNKEILEQIAKWQSRTESIVFIDGSFQYMSWDITKGEDSSALDPNLTFRIICPTKALSLHGFRFSYLLLPKQYEEEFDFILDNISGSSNELDILMANRTMTVLTSDESNTLLIRYIQKQYDQLVSEKLIAGKIHPSCGYFIFDQLLVNTTELVKMEGRFFDLKAYPDFYRINLLIPDLINELLKRKVEL